MYFSPVTLFCSQTDFCSIRAFSWSSLRGAAPFFSRSATVTPGVAFRRASALGVYQIGELQARS